MCAYVREHLSWKIYIYENLIIFENSLSIYIENFSTIRVKYCRTFSIHIRNMCCKEHNVICNIIYILHQTFCNKYVIAMSYLWESVCFNGIRIQQNVHLDEDSCRKTFPGTSATDRKYTVKRLPKKEKKKSNIFSKRSDETRYLRGYIFFPVPCENCVATCCIQTCLMSFMV